MKTETTELALVSHKAAIAPPATKAEMVQAMALVMQQENQKFNAVIQAKREALQERMMAVAEKSPRRMFVNFTPYGMRNGEHRYVVTIKNPELARINAAIEALPPQRQAYYETCLAEVKEAMKQERMKAVVDNKDVRKMLANALEGVGLLKKAVEVPIIS